jgi:ATP-binding cassette subfamily C (CFTR/MRP) protein 1
MLIYNCNNKCIDGLYGIKSNSEQGHSLHLWPLSPCPWEMYMWPQKHFESRATLVQSSLFEDLQVQYTPDFSCSRAALLSPSISHSSGSLSLCWWMNIAMIEIRDGGLLSEFDLRCELFDAQKKKSHRGMTNDFSFPLPSIADEWRASLLSRLIFQWIQPLLLLGRKKVLSHEDLGSNHPRDEPDNLIHLFTHSYSSRCLSLPAGPRRVLLALSDAYFVPLMARAGWCKLLSDALSFSPAFLLSALVKWADHGRPDALTGVMIAVALLLNETCVAVSFHNYLSTASLAALHARTGLQGAIFRKGLALGSSATESIPTLMAVDTERVMVAIWFFHSIWAMPLQVLVTIALLFRVLGVAASAGVVALLLLMPLQGRLTAILKKSRQRAVAFTDERVRLVGEVAAAARLVKFFAWERMMTDRITAVRVRELKEKAFGTVVAAVNTTVTEAGSLLVTLCAFSAYALVGSAPLTTSSAFTALSLFNVLRNALNIAPLVLSSSIAAWVSCGRMDALLSAKEPEGYVTLTDGDEGGQDGQLQSVGREVSVRGSFSWMPGAQTPTLSGIDLSIPAGSLAIVTGGVGSGSSSLLLALLGEIPPSSTSASVRRPRASYVPQLPWLKQATVRDNILFGAPLTDDSRPFYASVLTLCDLDKDLALLPAGDLTEIGERGVNLSGGQRARVALARAVFSRAPVAVLDDVLGACDPHVARTIFRELIVGKLRDWGTTVVLASHDPTVFASADLLVVMAQGRIEAQGAVYSDVLARSPTLRTLVEAQRTATESAHSAFERGGGSARGRREEDDDDDEDERDRGNGDGQKANAASVVLVVPEEQPTGDMEETTATRRRASSSSSGEDSSSGRRGRAAQREERQRRAAEEAARAAVPGARLVVVEDRAEGGISSTLYRDYLGTMGGAVVVVLLLALLAYHTLVLTTTWFLARWSEDAYHQPQAFYLRRYAALVLASLCMQGLYQGVWAVGGLRVARKLHERMLAAVVRSPVSFFDSTPAGRITNRFTGDIEGIEAELPVSFAGFLNKLASLACTVFVQVSLAPLLLVAAVPLLVSYTWLQATFRATNREIKRLDAISKSPIYNFPSKGLETIRAFQAAPGSFTAEHDQAISANTAALLKSMHCNRWLGVRLQWTGMVLSVGATAVVVAMALAGRPLDAGIAGMLVSSAMAIQFDIAFGVRNLADTEARMASVERVLTFCELPQEAPPSLPSDPRRGAWPSAGHVVLENVSITYRPDLPPVLRGVTADVPAGTKVGVCGRTGAGKSSLMMALFRMVECLEGRVVIDGVDLRSLGLDTLRSRLSIVMQDPIILTGTVRYNLDPSGAATDAQLWACLAKAHLADVVSALPGGLDAQIGGTGASQLSGGQKQMLALARLVLVNNKVMILDEATSATDAETDRLLQTMIRNDFAGSTVFAIAHRLASIADYDRVMVFDQGRLVEYDSPATLLRDPRSLFCQLWRAQRSEAI